MEEDDFIKKAKIKVLQEYQNKHEELILKDHDVLSKNVQNIGEAELSEHNMLLKDNKPRFQKQ